MSGFHKDMIAAGFGGQGIMVLGQLVAYAGIEDGRNVIWIPSYGPEMRGGTANCTVIVSDDPIGSPVLNSADVVIVMNQPSLEKFEHFVKPGGTLIYNSNLVEYKKPREDIKIVPVPAQELAVGLGSDKISNIVALGAVVQATGIVSEDAAVHVVKDKLGARKPEFLPMNLQAFEKGKETAQNALA